MSKVKEKQEKRRREILEKVLPILSDESFDDISVSEICAKIGISIGSFYHYFEKKSDLLSGFLNLIDDDIERNVAPLMTKEDEIENMKIFAHGWAEHVSAHGIERSRLISSINPEGNVTAESERTSVRILKEALIRGQEKGQITDEYDAGELSRMFLLTLRGITLDWSRRNGSYPIVERMDQYIAFFLKAYRKV